MRTASLKRAICWRSRFSITVLAFLVSLAAPYAHAVAGDDFLAARSAFAAGDARKYERAAGKVPADSVFQPYLAYWSVARQIEDDAKVADFLASYPGSWLAEKLRAEWLRSLGKRELWPAYLTEFAKLEKPETMHLCLARRAELALGERASVKDATAMWFSGRDLPTTCGPLFAWLTEQGYLTGEDVWKRLRLALEAGNPNVAKSLLSALPEIDRPSAVWIDRAYQAPADFLAKTSLDWTSRPHREVAFFALDRLARTDSIAAARFVEPALAALSEADQKYL